jgi:hypothetical protein
MRPRLLAALGVFLFTAGVYVASSPGRIDIIDGQYRFEVAKNLVEDTSIQIRDPFLSYAVNGVLGAYSPYGVSGSIAGVPLILLANATGARLQDRQQFFFSFTSAMLGAASAAVLFFFLAALGVPPRRAVWWTLVASFATLAFPAATATFDQTQHGFFILSACLLAFESARRDSMPLAAAAGACLAVLINYQETYVILLPTIAIAALAAPGATRTDRRRGRERAILVGFVGLVGVMVWMGINNFRFGSLLNSGKVSAHHPPALGNPLVGLSGLLVSPGKSILLYSPPTAFAVFGLSRLLDREQRLAQAVAATCVLYLGMIASLSFYGGDWCWGPRYFASVLPVLSLGFPFITFARRAARVALGVAVGAGFAVQMLALSVDHHRFFYGHSLPTFFWYTNPSYYFTHSALFARPAEVVDIAEDGVPPEADLFRPGPYAAQLTYAVFGGWGHPELPAPEWMRHYQVFWLPRPWPLWMRHVPADRRPVDLPIAESAVALLAAVGATALWAGERGLRESGA